MLDWKRIDKEPPPKDWRDIAFVNARAKHDVVIAIWDGDENFVWEGADKIHSLTDFTHWADIGPLPTMEPGHEL